MKKKEEHDLGRTITNREQQIRGYQRIWRLPDFMRQRDSPESAERTVM